MSYNNGPKIVTNGLVLYLDAGSVKSYPGSGTAWTDLSGNNNNGTLINGPTYSSSNKGSIVFDGINDYVNCGNNNSINLSGNFSICCWIYLNATPTLGQIIVEKGIYGNTDEYGLVLSGISTNGISIQCNNSFFYSNSTFPIQKWTFIAGTLSSTTGIYYQNGIVAATGSLTPPTTGSGVLYLSYRPSTSFYFNGRIASTQIYNRALSANEVSQNYNATKGRYNL